MAVSLANFKARFPEFASLGISDIDIQIYLDDSVGYIDESAWGTCYERAVYYLAAHLLSITWRNSEAVAAGGLSATTAMVGPVTSAGADGLSVGYAAPSQSQSSSEDSYRSTFYGQQYMALRDECVSGRRVASV